MNLNYVGSVAERFMQFSSGVFASEGVSEEVFNSLVIYLPSSLAADNLIDVDVFGVTNKPVALTVNVENYREKIKGDLLYQWEPVFRQDTNYDVTLTIIVFFLPKASLIPAAEIEEAALRAIADTAEGVFTSAETALTTAQGELNTATTGLATAQTAYDDAEEALAAILTILPSRQILLQRRRLLRTLTQLSTPLKQTSMLLVLFMTKLLLISTQRKRLQMLFLSSSSSVQEAISITLP